MSTGRPSWDEIIGRYGLSLVPQGGQLRGPCPLHGGTNPTAFVVDPARGFYCHACGQGGGVGTFVRLMGDVVRVGPARRTPQGVTAGPTRPALGDLRHLADDRSRVLAALPVVDPVAPRDPAHPYFAARGISPATIASVGGGVYAGAGPFHRRAVFPIWTPDGRLVGHIGRAVDAGVEPRYRCQRGLRKAALLYNEVTTVTKPLNTMKTTVPYDEVIVVEGVFDVLAVLEAGFPNVVALIGCMASPFQLAALSRYERVVSLLDGDGAGREGARRLRCALGTKVSIVDLDGVDPGGSDREDLRAALVREGCRCRRSGA